MESNKYVLMKSKICFTFICWNNLKFIIKEKIQSYTRIVRICIEKPEKKLHVTKRQSFCEIHKNILLLHFETIILKQSRHLRPVHCFIL